MRGDTTQTARLARFGGEPTWRGTWPSWPAHDGGTESAVLAALRSGRWTISGDSGPATARERQFATSFAAFLGVPFCVPTCNGSAAIVIALRAAGVRPGDEVLVPAMTWVGCASAIMRVGAVPRFVDCAPGRLTMCPAAARAATTARTRAILLVHAYCTNADLAAFSALAEESGLVLIEDCSHAHGSRQHGRWTGTVGRLGVFSMQQSKVLTCGEGGSVVTSDDRLDSLLQQHRADGRVYASEPSGEGTLLRTVADVHGANHTLSEIHAAILIDRLRQLPQENETRAVNASFLNILLAGVEGLTPLYAPTASDSPTIYRYVVALDERLLRAHDVEWWALMASAELGLPIERLYRPLPDSERLRPEALSMSSAGAREAVLAAIEESRNEVPESRHAYERCLAIPHRAFLGSLRECEAIASAFSKIARAVRS